MDAALLLRDADVLEPFFSALAAAGADGAGMVRLRAIGLAAEAAMLAETGGINTHRGAIFGLGLLCAAAGLRSTPDRDGRPSLGSLVRERWGEAIRAAPASPDSHGAGAALHHGAAGARGEAASGFASVYRIGRPALNRGWRLGGSNAEAARVQAVFALIAGVEDTNLLHRGGRDGLAFAQGAAAAFLHEGGVGAPGWRDRAASVHRAFVARRLSPRGAADLVAMTLFVQAVDDGAVQGGAEGET